ncbi:glycosyltransferase [Jeotgalibaca porci]|uniref:Glycosyltransferase n=1 Tax=Jeotgalibaca porci TaxID=1868793 RepID=A0A6G7WG86_9LACT|nr:glycosyltransferase [Jeotgalibaca porci]QIK51208.1 glycosyltransferase [Jeotgalibaca porci]
MNAKISIIIPVYNAAEYLDKNIQSILGQSYTNLELILVDDGSKDTSAEIMRKYQDLDSRVIALFQKNSGAPTARNYGLSIATGDYIQFVDSDDYMAEDALINMATALNNSDCDVVISAYDTVDENEKAIKKIAMPLEANHYSVSDHRMTLSLLPPMPGNKLFRASVISDNELEFEPSLRQAQDLNFYLKVLLFSEKVVILDTITYHYRVRAGSISHTYTLVILEVIKSIRNVKDFYLQNGMINEKLFSNIKFHHYNFQIQKIPQILNLEDRKIAMQAFKKEFETINHNDLLPNYRGKKYFINRLKMFLQPVYTSKVYTRYQNTKEQRK